MVVAMEESYNGEHATGSINRLEDPYLYDEDAEETISLCDLPIYSDDSNCDDYSKQDQSASFDNEDSFFEFFSDDCSASNYSGSDNIIFCGKLIPYKQASKSQTRGNIVPEEMPAKNCQFRTRSSSFNDKKPSAVEAKGPEIASARMTGVKSFNSFTIPMPKDPECITRKRSRKLDKYELSGERAMILDSSPMKSRWFLFMFGSARFPKEMKLSDMRLRQRRSSRSAMFRPSEEKTVGRGSNGKKTTGHVMWKLLRALLMGCRGKDENFVVNGSFSPIPLE